VRAISLHQGNLSRIARDLEVSRSTLYRKLRAYGLEKFVPSNTSLSAIAKTKRTRATRPAAQERGAVLRDDVSAEVSHESIS